MPRPRHQRIPIVANNRTQISITYAIPCVPVSFSSSPPSLPPDTGGQNVQEQRRVSLVASHISRVITAAPKKRKPRPRGGFVAPLTPVASPHKHARHDMPRFPQLCQGSPQFCLWGRTRPVSPSYFVFMEWVEALLGLRIGGVVASQCDRHHLVASRPPTHLGKRSKHWTCRSSSLGQRRINVQRYCIAILYVQCVHYRK